MALPLLGAIVMGLARADETRALPAAVFDERNTASSETAVLAGGCFWGMQGVFEHVKGVTKVVAGYSGGEKNTAEYETVSTRHHRACRSVQIAFDPRQVSFLGRNPARLFLGGARSDRAEPSGAGRRDAVPFGNLLHESAPGEGCRAYIAQLEKAHVFSSPIVTRVEATKGFYPAEGYHQDYLIHHPESAVHSGERSAEDRASEAALSAALPGSSGYGDSRPLRLVIKGLRPLTKR